MNTIRLLCACGLISLLPSWGTANAQTKCTQASVVGCRDTVFETPAGVIDGKNSGFSLKRIPSSSDSVRLFLNNIELLQDADFRVTGQNLTLFGKAVPKAGDEIRAMYQVQRVDPTIGAPTVAGSADQTKLILRAALTEAASNEPVPSGTQTLPALVVNKQPAAPPAVENRRSMRSLSLLARRIDQNQHDGSARSNESGQQLSGFDGIGDVPITSQYSVLLGAEPTDAAQLLKVPSGTSKRSVSPTPRSIAMLQRRFNAVAKDEDDKTGKK